MAQHQQTPQSQPRVFTDGENLLISLDGQEPRTKEGGRVDPPRRPFRDWLHFSVTRGGTLKFAKKVRTIPEFETRIKFDEEGNPIPHPAYQKAKELYGDTRIPQYVMERVLLEEPHVELFYEVNEKWWNAHGRTKVLF